MKHRHPLFVFLLLIASSVLAGFHSYSATERDINKDLQQALAQTLREKQRDVLTPDTISTFNRHLQIAELRGKAVLSLNTEQPAINLEAHCPTGTILTMSDQRPSVALASMAFIWAIGCSMTRRRSYPTPGFGGLSLVGDCFFNSQHQEVKFTPMQHQLMLLFFRSPDHRLSKTEICEALWPKKDDANETLYTLIRRLKPVLEAHSELKITTDRGRAYQLKDSKLS